MGNQSAESRSSEQSRQNSLQHKPGAAGCANGKAVIARRDGARSKLNGLRSKCGSCNLCTTNRLAASTAVKCCFSKPGFCRKFIEQFKSMNFVNDEEVNQQLETVRKELLTKTAEEYRDSTKARGQLVDGLSQLRDTAERLATQEATQLVQRFGELGRRKFHLAA